MIIFKPIKRKFLIDGFYSAFRFDWDESFTFCGESHNFWEAVFVKSGTVEVTENENVYTLDKGNIIFHSPMEFHRIKSAYGSSPTVFVISFSVTGNLPEKLGDGVFTLNSDEIGECEDICKMALKFKSCESGADTPATYDTELLGQELSDRLSLFLTAIGRRATRGSISMTQSAMEYRKLVSFMLTHVCENLTLSEIAKSNNVSVSYTKLLFKTYAGISPKAYFNKLRVRCATELLNKGQSITDIAELMNFSSPNYFSAFYKKLTGVSPTSHQKNTVT